MKGLQVAAVRGALELEQIQDLRRSVLCGELNWPRDVVREPQDATASHFLASLGSKPVGSARLSEIGGRFFLELLLVLSSFRRQGIGRELVAAAAAEAQKKGALSLELLVDESLEEYFLRQAFLRVATNASIVEMKRSF
jgi:GNAT superfamily N-acetyltransferase